MIQWANVFVAAFGVLALWDLGRRAFLNNADRVAIAAQRDALASLAKQLGDKDRELRELMHRTASDLRGEIRAAAPAKLGALPFGPKRT